ATAERQLHSDQGFQYTSTGYLKLTKRYNITPSMSRRGNPYDNAVMENFSECLRQKRFGLANRKQSARLACLSTITLITTTTKEWV
ncbi:MAG: transposase family protein, partial [Clostridia bacterium]|nr:transposase family protein [Clostridia bacterium]